MGKDTIGIKRLGKPSDYRFGNTFDDVRVCCVEHERTGKFIAAKTRRKRTWWH